MMKFKMDEMKAISAHPAQRLSYYAFLNTPKSWKTLIAVLYFSPN